VGRNYAAHAAELGNSVPGHPLIFLKPPSSRIAGGEPIVLPADSQQVEYEGEIAVVVGRRLRRAEPAEALGALSHVVPLNDITARDLQRGDGQWTRAKGFDSFCPMGEPVPVGGIPGGAVRLTAEAGDDALEVVTRVNGEQRQRGRVTSMAFPIPFLVAWISRVMTLEPGDVISTGTPAGVGPLAPGDIVRVEIPGVGAVENPVVAP
jgi:2-keto-4-pentenoate hydratase/2-oxohepta-3-ene-1,7-dioic acid hydratase in catechol pathway